MDFNMNLYLTKQGVKVGVKEGEIYVEENREILAAYLKSLVKIKKATR